MLCEVALLSTAPAPAASAAPPDVSHMDDKTQDRSLHVVLASLLGGGKAHAGRYIHQQPMLTLELGIRAYTRAKVEVPVLWQVGTSANARHQLAARVHDALRVGERR